MNKKVILPCPFCGEIPVLERQYLPASLCLSCKNDNCYVNPAIEITVFCNVMTVKQKDDQGGESSKEVRFSKYTDDDKVVVNNRSIFAQLRVRPCLFPKVCMPKRF